jgi:hypothetical protein
MPSLTESEKRLIQRSRGRCFQNQLAVEIQASASGADMDLRTSKGSESRFSAFVERLVSVIGHADRARPLLIIASA